MKQSAHVSGMDGFLRKLKEHPELVARTQLSVLTQEARALCVGYGAATLPGPGFDEGKAESFRKKVESEVGRVFLTRASKSTLYELVKRRSPRLAAGFWRAVKEGRDDQIRKILRDAGVNVERLDPALHRAARTGRRGEVRKGFRGETLVSEPQLRAYRRKKAALVGFAKAGWYQAARGLGGRVRRNIVETGGKRRTEEIFPGYVRKLARRFPDAGGARVLTWAGRARVEIFTRVRHAEQALPAGLRRGAEGIARQRLAGSMREALSALHRKRFKVA